MKCNPWRWAWGLIPLILLGWVALLAERERIENDLTARSSESLARAGLPWAKVKFRGRDGEISGLASDEAEPEKAAALVRDLRGVRVVDNAAKLVEKVDTYTWQAALSKGRVRLSGFVPNEETRKTVLGVAKAKFTGREIEDRMKVARGAPARDTWLGGINFGLNQLSALKTGVVDLESTSLSIAGEAEDTGGYRSVKTALSRGLPQGLKLKQDNVTPPVVSPYLWSARWGAKRVVLGGFVASEALRQSIVSAVKKAFPDVAVEDRMELAAGAPDGWAKSVGSAVTEFARLREGNAELKGSQFSVAGLAEDESRAEIARRALRTTMPSGIRFADQIRFPEPPKPDPAEIEAKRRAEEEAKRRAEAEAAAKRATEEEARRRAEAEAAAKRTAEEEAKRRAEAESAARRADEEARRKAEAEAAARRAAQEAEAKQKAAAEAEARKRAEADAAAKRAAAEAEARRQAEQEVAAAKRRAELQKCQDALNVAKQGVILFQRASAELDARSNSTLDKVARAAQACPSALIEIGGHTDAEGTPERNQKLSERRAQSIVSYLVKAGVDAGKLTAVGYGQDRPVAPNDTPENRAKNRRIEFSVKTN